MFPVMFSEVVGLKVTFRVLLCPGAKVIGGVSPLVAKSFAPTLTWEMTALEFPVFVIVTVWELELPTLIPAKLKLVGFAESVTVAAVPVPLRATAVGELGALLAMFTVPVRLPAVVGAN